MVDLEVAELEQCPASGAFALLPPIQLVFEIVVMPHLVDVGPHRIVGAVGDLAEDSGGVGQPVLHKVGRLFRQVDADPFTLEMFRRDAGGGADRRTGPAPSGPRDSTP